MYISYAFKLWLTMKIYVLLSSSTIRLKHSCLTRSLLFLHFHLIGSKRTFFNCSGVKYVIFYKFIPTYCSVQYIQHSVLKTLNSRICETDLSDKKTGQT